MSWTRNSRLGGAVAMLAMAGAASAATLVVRATGPAARNFPPGRALVEGRKLVLGPNDQVTVLDARGTRTFKGPGSFDVAAASATATTGATIAALVSQPSARRARIGAVRAVGGTAAPRSPNLWYVEADRSGPHCLADTGAVTLWRPNMTAEQRYTISGGGRSETITWLRGQSARDWPAGVPVVANTDYTIAAEGQTAPAKLRFVMVPAPADGALDGLAARLIAAKCTAQLDLLVDTAGADAPAG